MGFGFQGLEGRHTTASAKHERGKRGGNKRDLFVWRREGLVVWRDRQNPYRLIVCRAD